MIIIIIINNIKLHLNQDKLISFMENVEKEYLGIQGCTNW